ncbi:MAG: dimethylargininase [Kangiellaceae bacterium]
MFTYAIVRKPSESMLDGITEANLGLPNYVLALAQHQDYILALQQCGLKVIQLEPLAEYPDACFVEDVALITPKCAILTHPGAATRKGEVMYIAAALDKFFPSTGKIEAPGTLEAGDIMMVGKHYYIGLSQRTNAQGAKQLIDILERHGLSGSIVEMSGLLHLKTGLSYLENNHMLTFGDMYSHPDFSHFNRIKIETEEAYAANSVWINDTVLVPKGFPKALSAIKNLGYKIREIDMSEFQKLDGGLSCLSLRF